MPQSKLRAPGREPTPFADLNALLADFAAGLEATLPDILVGLWLQGSFALEAGDEASDVDFVAALRRDLDPGEQAALQSLHSELHHRPTPWAERLEGSYFPLRVLRRRAGQPSDPPGEAPRPADWLDPATQMRGPSGYPLLFIGNGHEELVRSEHDDTQVVRWITRERGVVLAGADPRGLIAPVTGQDLDAEVRRLLFAKSDDWLAYDIDAQWVWAFFITICCRMLHTLSSGEVASKKAGTDWALAHLNSAWAEPIQAAYDMGRESIARRIEPAPSDRAEQARAFVRYAVELARVTPPWKPARALPSSAGPRTVRREGHGPRLSRGAGPGPVRPGGRGRRG